MAYGNTSVSALLNQARAALKKQQGLEEEIAAYEYDLSPKDQAAFDKYNSFLSNRIKQVQSTDQSKALSLQRKITGAQRTFSSSELTRESIGIAEGTGSKPAKLQKMISLYRRALENGDENLAQRIQLQADNLQVQIQNEAMAAAGRGGGGGGSSRKTEQEVYAENKIAQLTDDFQYAVDSLKNLGNKALGDIQSNGGQTYFGTLKGIIEEVTKTYQELAASTDDPAKKQKYLEEAKKASSNNYDIGMGSGKKTLEDINQYIQGRGVQGAGNPTSIVNKDGKFSLQDNAVAGSMYAKLDGKNVLLNKYALGGDETYAKYAKAAFDNLKSKGVSGVNVGKDGKISFNDPVTGQTVFGTADQYGNVLYKAKDDQGNDIVRRFVTKEGKDEVVSQQEQDAIINAGNVASNDPRAVDLKRPDGGIEQSLYDAKGAVGKFAQNLPVIANAGAATQEIAKNLKPGVEAVQKAGGVIGDILNPLDSIGTIQDFIESPDGLTKDASKVINYAKSGKLIGDAKQWASSVGKNPNFTGAFNAINPLSQWSVLQKQIDGFKAQKQQKDAAEAQARAEEFQRNQQIYQQAVAAQAAAQSAQLQRSVLGKQNQNYDQRSKAGFYETITNPAARSQAAVTDFNKQYNIGQYKLR